MLLQAGPVWTHAVNVTASGPDLFKAGPAGWAVMSRSLRGTGAVEFTVGEKSTYKVAGLSHGDTDQSYADIDYGFYLRKGGVVSILENGVSRGSFGTYVRGDIFRQEATSTEVRYLRNGVLLYTSTVAPTFPLALDVSLFSTGATIQNARVIVSP